ncbi:Fanconi anemia group G protein isoform X2 [Latimeria chalumnae]|uniref:Fanconi anemia group G protein isoform X2 n=1 Tax=Latimeria chalumnae TaxID=7897 RepID=UPI00313E6309
MSSCSSGRGMEAVVQAIEERAEETEGMDERWSTFHTKSSCLEVWAEENSSIVNQWQAQSTGQNADQLKRTKQQCCSALRKLLQKIQGLPPTLPSLPLELTVLYNTIILQISSSECITEQDVGGMNQGLFRVLEATGACSEETDMVEVWHQVWDKAGGGELGPSLSRLACLQGALWLPGNQLEKIQALFHLLSTGEVPLSSASTKPGTDLLTLIKNYSLPEEANPASHLLIQSAGSLREILYTCAAFIQGFLKMEEGVYSDAVHILQKAAAGFCSKRLLAQIYTLTGSCVFKMHKPQTALQYFKEALQVDFGCLPALYQSSVLYHQLEMLDAEMKALSLLYEALENQDHSRIFVDPHLLIHSDVLIQIPALNQMFTNPSQAAVKYLMATRGLQRKRVGQAVEHYLDLLALFQAESGDQVFLDSQSVLPRIPEVYLETALALLNAKRHHDVLTVCEEVVSKTLALVPERLVLELFPAGPRRTESADGCGELRYSGPAASELHWAKESHPLASRKRESLNHAIWTAAAYLYQGQAFAQLQDTMESITCFTRCINLLHRVQVVFSGNDHTCAESLGDKAVEIKWFQKLKALAFFGRGMQFQERGQERESLHNFQLSLQAVPDNLEAAYFLVELLWKTNRKQEAASCWLRVQNSLGKEAGEKAIPKREYPLYLQLHLRKVHAAEEELVSEKIHKYSSTSGHGT